MLSSRNLSIAGACFLAVGFLLSCLFFLLSLGGTPWGVRITYGTLLFFVLAGACFIWIFLRDMPGGWGKARGLGILALLMLPIVYLAWVSREPSRGAELLPHATFLIVAIAAIIAAFSGLAATKSAESASKSLELARATTRPFLNVVTQSPQPDEPTMRYDNNNFRITLQVKNTGGLPANDVLVSCYLYTSTTGEGGEQLDHADRYSPSIYFPQDIVAHTFVIKRERLQECQAAKSTIRVELTYKNQITERTCITKRFFDYPQFGTTPMSPANSTHDKDYWD